MSDAGPKVPAPKSSLRAVQRTAIQLRREKKAVRRNTVFELIMSGYGYDQVAAKLKPSVAAVRREVDRTLAARDIGAPQRYVGLQLARFGKALQIVDLAMDVGDLRSIPALIRVMGEFDRYHGLAGRLKSPPAAENVAAQPVGALEKNEPPESCTNWRLKVCNHSFAERTCLR